MGKDLNKSSEFVRQLIEQSAKQIDNINECGLLDAENTLKNYEEFEKIFDEEQGKASRRLEENQQAPERFEEISEDQAYVEGRWHGTDHQAAVDKGAVGFTTEAITNIKRESSIQMERHQDGRVDRIIHDGMENGKTLMITMKLIMWRHVIW